MKVKYNVDKVVYLGNLYQSYLVIYFFFKQFILNYCVFIILR